jgi:VWFA-related protein
MTLNKLGIAQEGRMKKQTFVLLALLCLVNLFSQVEQHEVDVVNIEVPVRVTDGGKFVEELQTTDFEVYEDGILQTIESFYLIKNAKLSHQEVSSLATPDISRSFIFLFQCTDYNPQISEAIDYFFQQVLLKGDTLAVMTPLGRYALSKQALRSKSKNQLSRDLESKIRRDTIIGAGEYNSLLNDLKRIVRSIASSAGARPALTGIDSDAGSGFDLELQLPRYKETLDRLDVIRMVDEQKLITFAHQLKPLDGQKIVFFFYQREFRPEIEARILNQIITLNQDRPEILNYAQDLFLMYNRSIEYHADRITEAFSDSSVMFNFIYMHKEPEDIRGIKMQEQSEDVFNLFTQVALATGGISDSSQNPSVGFQNAADACAQYYLLVYSPQNYKSDGSFRRIKVYLKDKNFNVTHRVGYYAK